MSVLTDLVEQDFGLRLSGDWGRTEKHDSFIVDMVRNIWYWNSEHEKGNTEDYLVLVRKMSRNDAKNFLRKMSGVIEHNIKPKKEVSYETHKAVVDVMWKGGRNNTEYWDDRLLTKQTINLFRLGYWKGFYTVPIFDGNELVNIQLRQDKPEKKVRWWYRGGRVRDVLFQSHILNFTDTVFIVEGLIDAILLRQYNIPAVAPTGGASHWKDVWFQRFIRTKNIYCMMDNDRAGEMFGNLVADNLGKYRVKLYKFDGKPGYDSRDFFKDGGTPDEYRSLIGG